VILMVAGLLGLVVPNLEKVTFDPISWELGGGEVILRLTWFFLTLILGVLILTALAFWFPGRFNPLQKFVLNDAQVGYTAGGTEYDNLQGKTGITVSPLRPSGRIDIDGAPYDAQSSGDFISAGQKVIVERIEGARLFVRIEK